MDHTRIKGMDHTTDKMNGNLEIRFFACNFLRFGFFICSLELLK